MQQRAPVHATEPVTTFNDAYDVYGGPALYNQTFYNVYVVYDVHGGPALYNQTFYDVYVVYVVYDVYGGPVPCDQNLYDVSRSLRSSRSRPTP